MIREDALLDLKKAENIITRLVEEANFAKARRDAALFFGRGNNKIVCMNEVNHYVN